MLSSYLSRGASKGVSKGLACRTYLKISTCLLNTRHCIVTSTILDFTVILQPLGTFTVSFRVCVMEGILSCDGHHNIKLKLSAPLGENLQLNSCSLLVTSAPLLVTRASLILYVLPFTFLSLSLQLANSVCLQSYTVALALCHDVSILSVHRLDVPPRPQSAKSSWFVWTAKVSARHERHRFGAKRMRCAACTTHRTQTCIGILSPQLRYATQWHTEIISDFSPIASLPSLGLRARYLMTSSALS